MESKKYFISQFPFMEVNIEKIEIEIKQAYPTYLESNGYDIENENEGYVEFYFTDVVDYTSLDSIVAAHHPIFGYTGNLVKHEVALTDYTACNGKVDIYYLKHELATVFGDKVIAVTDDGKDIWFNDVLSQIEINALNAVISNHNNLPKLFKAFRHIPTTASEILRRDYDILGFHKERILINGELREVNYWRNYDQQTNTYSDLIVKENRDFIRNPAGLPLERILNVKWYLEDGTIGCAIVDRIKYYQLDQAIDEVVVRRKNIITKAKQTVLQTFLVASQGDLTVTLTEVAEFLATVGSDTINLYIEGNGVPLNNAITNLTLSYVTTDLKTNLLNILNYNYTS